MPRFSDPERLDSGHVPSGFDCGEAALDLWLERHARASSGAGSATNYVATDAGQSGRVVGYHALATASIEQVKSTERARNGWGSSRFLRSSWLDSLLIARSGEWGSVPSCCAMGCCRTLAVSEEVGVRLLLAHALNESARSFYLHFGFEPSPTDPMNLQRIIKDLKKVIAGLPGNGHSR